MDIGTVDGSIQLAFGASSPVLRETRRPLYCRDGWRRRLYEYSFTSVCMSLKLHFSDEGVIDKKTWIAFLSELEEKS